MKTRSTLCLGKAVQLGLHKVEECAERTSPDRGTVHCTVTAAAEAKAAIPSFPLWHRWQRIMQD